MDKILRDRLTAIHKQISLLFEAEKLSGELEASEKTMYAQLFLATDSTQSIEQRKNIVYASRDWRDFSKGLVLAQAQKNQARRLLELLNAAFQAEYLEHKITHDTIKKQL